MYQVCGSATFRSTSRIRKNLVGYRVLLPWPALLMIDGQFNYIHISPLGLLAKGVDHLGAMT